MCSGICAECVENKDKCTACRNGQVLEKDTCVPEKEPCQAGRSLTVFSELLAECEKKYISVREYTLTLNF